MNYIPGYFPAQPPMYQMPQPGYGVPQAPAQMDAATQNAYTAVQLIPNILQAILQSGQANQQEVAYLQNYLYTTPGQLQKFQQYIVNMFGQMTVSPQQIYQSAYERIMAAIQQMRRNQSAVQMPMPVPGAPAPQYAAPVNYAQPISRETANMMEMYGNDPAASQATNPNMAPPQNPTPTATTIHPQGEVKKVQVNHTNKAYDIVIPDDDVPRPQWFEENVSQDKPSTMEKRNPSEPTMYKTYRLLAQPTIDMRVCMWRIPDCMLDANGAFNEIEEAKEVQQIDSDIDMISYDEVVPIQANYLDGKQVFEEVKSKYNANKTPATAHEILKDLRGKGTVGALLLGLIIKQFNQAASVNFMRFDRAINGVERLPIITDEVQLSRLLTDSGDEEFESWKTPEEYFNQALRTCITSSFNRIFSTVTTGYLDPSKAKDRSFMLMRFYDTLRIKGGLETVMSKTMTEEQEKDIQAKLNRMFFLKIEKKVMIHNLDVANIGEHNFNAFPIESGLGRFIMSDAFQYFGSIDLIDRKDQTQLKHPLRLGMLYGNMAIVRRM